MVFENVTNVVFTNTCNFNLNPIELSNDAFTFCSILFQKYMFIMFFNTKQLNCIIFDKTKSNVLKKNLTCSCDIFANTMFITLVNPSTSIGC